MALSKISLSSMKPKPERDHRPGKPGISPEVELDLSPTGIGPEVELDLSPTGITRGGTRPQTDWDLTRGGSDKAL